MKAAKNKHFSYIHCDCISTCICLSKQCIMHLLSPYSPHILHPTSSLCIEFHIIQWVTNSFSHRYLLELCEVLTLWGWKMFINLNKQYLPSKCWRSWIFFFFFSSLSMGHSPMGMLFWLHVKCYAHRVFIILFPPSFYFFSVNLSVCWILFYVDILETEIDKQYTDMCT